MPMSEFVLEACPSLRAEGEEPPPPPPSHHPPADPAEYCFPTWCHRPTSATRQDQDLDGDAEWKEGENGVWSHLVCAASCSPHRL